MRVSVNNVVVAGNLCRDPELRHTESGASVCHMRLAINEKFGNGKECVTFIEIECWGKQAKSAAEYLNKGSAILVQGGLRLNTWEKDGEPRSKIFISARRIQFLDSKKEGESESDKEYPKMKDNSAGIEGPRRGKEGGESKENVSGENCLVDTESEFSDL